MSAPAPALHAASATNVGALPNLRVHNAGPLPDLYVVSEDGQTYPAHRVVLSLSSGVLATAIDKLEHVAGTAPRLEVAMKSVALDFILRCIYPSAPPAVPSLDYHLLPILTAVEKYDITAAMDHIILARPVLAWRLASGLAYVRSRIGLLMLCNLNITANELQDPQGWIDLVKINRTLGVALLDALEASPALCTDEKHGCGQPASWWCIYVAEARLEALKTPPDAPFAFGQTDVINRLAPSFDIRHCRKCGDLDGDKTACVRVIVWEAVEAVGRVISTRVGRI